MEYLVMEDGTVYEGEGFGDLREVVGEVVFNTGMTGYQEVLTDPQSLQNRHCGIMVILTGHGLENTSLIQLFHHFPDAGLQVNTVFGDVGIHQFDPLGPDGFMIRRGAEIVP